ncbi:hypothetical protein FRB95_013711 [Tulasnella sp. JGI-2019a]|nr:hypothetical protein FRB95_013711 [Tulasnella sp. JGI-2019a]
MDASRQIELKAKRSNEGWDEKRDVGYKGERRWTQSYPLILNHPLTTLHHLRLQITMRFAAVSLALLIAPLSVMANLAIRSSSYDHKGNVKYDLLAFPNAPSTYKIQLLNTCTGDSSIIENDVGTKNGTNTVSLPSSTKPGAYQALLVNPIPPADQRLLRRAAAPLHTYAATVPYNVAAADFLSS